MPLRPLLLLGLVCATATAQELRPASYDLDVTFRPADCAMTARADIRFAPAPERPDEVVFYLHGELDVDSLAIGGTPVPIEQDKVLYEYDASLVATRVRVPSEGLDLAAGLHVRYSGAVHRSSARSPSDYMRIDQDGVYLRSYGYSLWFPVFLEAGRDTYPVSFPEVVLRTPAEFTAVFAGRKVDERIDGGTRVATWSARDLDLFAAQCTARRFTNLGEGAVVIHALGDARSREIAADILSFTRRLCRFYDDRYRPAAAGRALHVLQMPEYGDIASGNVVGFSEEHWAGFDPATFTGRTLAHELVHASVWSPVSIDDPLYALIIEGFPSYFHLPALGAILGADHERAFLDRVQDRYLQRRETGRDARGNRLPPEKPIAEITAAELSVYKDRFVLNDRAVLFLDYLRRRLGEDGFRDWTRDIFGGDALDRRSFVASIERHLPDSAGDIALWLSTTEYPERFRRSS